MPRYQPIILLIIWASPRLDDIHLNADCITLADIKIDLSWSYRWKDDKILATVMTTLINICIGFVFDVRRVNINIFISFRILSCISLFIVKMDTKYVFAKKKFGLPYIYHPLYEQYFWKQKHIYAKFKNNITQQSIGMKMNNYNITCFLCSQPETTVPQLNFTFRSIDDLSRLCKLSELDGSWKTWVQRHDR